MTKRFVRAGVRCVGAAVCAVFAAVGMAADVLPQDVVPIALLRSDLSGEQRQVRIRGVVTWRREGRHDRPG
jgi:hypothetical protein